MAGELHTFVFADIESTAFVIESAGDRYRFVLASHREVLTHAFEACGGEDVRAEGSNVLAAFEQSRDGVLAAVAAQQALLKGDGDGPAVGVRIGVHAGSGERTPAGFVGLGLNEAARVCSVAQPGQILTSETAVRSAGALPGAHISFRGAGKHKLKDLLHPLELFQVCHPALPLHFGRTGGPDVHLAAYTTPFIGRDDEADDVIRSLEGQARIVTVTGTAGVGKTRLAIEVAGMVANRFPDGVWQCSMHALASPDDVVAAICAVVVPDGEVRDADALVHHLDGRSTLLLIDGFERLIDAASVLSQLTQRLPLLELLVTSAEGLGLAGESVSRLQPLPVLAGDDAGPRMFYEVAGIVAGDGGDPETVLTLCRQLDGLPLAIECAGREARSHSPAALLQGLEAVAGLPPWLDPLQAAFDRQCSVLTTPEIALLRRLATRPGAFSLGEVTGLPTTADIDRLEILEAFDALVTKSLVHAEGTGSQFTMLNTMRRYARASSSRENHPAV